MDASSTDYGAFLAARLPRQERPLAPYQLPGEQVWIKKAGPRHARWRYFGLDVAARALRLPVLRPVPNPGGPEAIRIEARRLRQLAAAGLRVPPVLAEARDGFLMRHLGVPGTVPASLAEEMRDAMPGGAAPVIALWRQGLEALARVHAADQCLSQAFARNFVRCPDGVVGYVDFEDDPAARLPLPVCQARDVLCYAHSTALYLHDVGAFDAGRAIWRDWMERQPPAVRTMVAISARRLGWMRRLPDDRRWGRDAQRARLAFDLLR
ncbi:MAG: hypothetical protein PGN26_02395 [Xylophilus ampelinus]